MGCVVFFRLFFRSIFVFFSRCVQQHNTTMIVFSLIGNTNADKMAVGIQARAYHGGNTAANADVLKDFCATPRMSGMVPNVCVR